jgi:hypothetical protein
VVNPHLVGEPLYGAGSNLFVILWLIAWIIGGEDHSLCGVRQSGHCISTVQFEISKQSCLGTLAAELFSPKEWEVPSLGCVIWQKYPPKSTNLCPEQRHLLTSTSYSSMPICLCLRRPVM